MSIHFLLLSGLSSLCAICLSRWLEVPHSHSSWKPGQAVPLTSKDKAVLVRAVVQVSTPVGFSTYLKPCVTGRVRPGICFHLYSGFTRDRHMLAHQIPEIKRQLLDEIVLQIMLLKLDSTNIQSGVEGSTRTRSAAFRFLRATIEPPASEAILAAETRLINMGAVITKRDGDGQETHELSPLGVHLSSLPLSPNLGKMLVFGTILRCIDPVLTIAVGHADG